MTWTKADNGDLFPLVEHSSYRISEPCSLPDKDFSAPCSFLQGMHACSRLFMAFFCPLPVNRDEQMWYCCWNNDSFNAFSQIFKRQKQRLGAARNCSCRSFCVQLIKPTWRWETRGVWKSRSKSTLNSLNWVKCCGNSQCFTVQTISIPPDAI